MSQQIDGDNNVQIGGGKQTTQSIVGSGNIQSGRGPGRHSPPVSKYSRKLTPEEAQELASGWIQQKTKEDPVFIPCINWFDNNPFDFLKPKPKKKKSKTKPKESSPYEPYPDPQKPYPYDPKEKQPWNPEAPWGKRTPNPYKYPQWRDDSATK